MNEERRGWEISTEFHKHYLDDPYWDFAEDGVDDIPWKGWLICLGILAAVIAATYYLGGPL
jgi:hypothetical protein